VLIVGETGSGKGFAARLLHRLGPRAHGPFVDVNCAAVPETLLEAEERTVRRLGGTRSEPVDVCLISATNADLIAAVRARRFREDLYHRLAVIRLAIPPLRERGNDIVVLAEHFLARACREYGLPVPTLTAEARERLLAHAWPGNVRELANVMERAVLMTDAREITAAVIDLPAAPPPPGHAGVTPAPGRSLDDVTRAHVRAVLDQCAGNVSRAAAVLGIARNTLSAYVRRFALEAAAARAPAPLSAGTAPGRLPSTAT
jgi:DNA-binding NtrC family response regulator